MITFSMNRKYIIAGTITGLIVIYLFGTMVVERRLGEMRDYVQERVVIQTALMQDTARVLGRGGSNEAVSVVVPECPAVESIRFDELLASLDKGLSRADLTELSSLFNQCGDVAARRRAGMALFLEQEYTLLKELTALQNQLHNRSDEESNSADWEELVKLEKEISVLFSDLVEAQGRIIALLMNNVAPTDIAVENIRSAAQTVREELTKRTGTAATLRASLLDS